MFWGAGFRNLDVIDRWETGAKDVQRSEVDKTVKGHRWHDMDEE